MENITVEKRKRITYPYKELYKKWQQIAYGLTIFCAVVLFLLFNAMRGIK